jgi:hypothetical protein
MTKELLADGQDAGSYSLFLFMSINEIHSMEPGG